MKKILVLYSEKIHPIEDKIDFLKVDRRLENYDINYQYLIDFLAGDAGYAKKKFEAIIEKIQPDIILIHVGIVMHEEPAFFIDLFNELHLEYPHIVFSMDRIDHLFKFIDRNFMDIFYCREELKILMEIFF